MAIELRGFDDLKDDLNPCITTTEPTCSRACALQQGKPLQ